MGTLPGDLVWGRIKAEENKSRGAAEAFIRSFYSPLMPSAKKLLYLNHHA